MTTIAPETPAQRRRAARPAPARRSVARRSVDGTVLGHVELDPELFGIEPNVGVLHQVVTAQLSAARAGTQSTRTRAEVAGGGAKPFRQKGTGRARQGSTRAPQWSGGGVAMGPKPRSYRQRTPKKMIRLALRSALSDRAAQGQVALVDDWGMSEPKTKLARAALEALGLTGRVMVVLDPDDWAAQRSFANLPRVQVVPVTELNAYDIIRSDWLVFTDHTLPGASSAKSGTDETAAATGAAGTGAPTTEAPTTGSDAATRSDAATGSGTDETGAATGSGQVEPGAPSGDEVEGSTTARSDLPLDAAEEEGR